MTNQSLIPFSFETHQVTAFVDERGEPWFGATDICKVLGYRNPRDAIAKHCRPEGVAKRDTLTGGGKQEVTVINEGNLYRLIIKSRKAEAEKFERWVCDEVLPTIRKTGRYEIPKTKKALPNGLTLEQQDAIKALVKSRVEALPQDKRAGGAIRCWSSLKSKFGCTYKEIHPDHFSEALSLVARLPLEGEVLHHEEPMETISYRQAAYQQAEEYTAACRAAVEDAGGKLPEWPQLNESVADGLVAHIIWRARYITWFDSDLRLRVTPIEHHDCLINPRRIESLSILLGEMVPPELIPAIMQLCVQRLSRMANVSLPKH